MQNSLRTFIRAVLTENYNVSIVASPISTGEKRKRGQKPEEDIIANVILTRGDFDNVVSLANERDVLRSLGDEDDQAIKLRIDEIRTRVNPATANLARALIKQAKERDPAVLEEILFNMPDETGTVTPEHPILGKDYPIPEAFRQLALAEKPGAKGIAIGKGEALAILMFGRAENAGPEPDLIISDDLMFSIKYFENASSTVYVSSGLAASEGIDTLVGSTTKLRQIARDKGLLQAQGKAISRSQMKTMLAAIHDDIKSRFAGREGTTIYVSSDLPRADLDASGIAGDEVNEVMSAKDVLQLIQVCGSLWDSTAFSQYPILALQGLANMKFVAEAAEDSRLGSINYGKQIPELMIASPKNAKIMVRPGAASTAGGEDEG